MIRRLKPLSTGRLCPRVLRSFQLITCSSLAIGTRGGSIGRRLVRCWGRLDRGVVGPAYFQHRGQLMSENRNTGQTEYYTLKVSTCLHAAASVNAGPGSLDSLTSGPAPSQRYRFLRSGLTWLIQMTPQLLGSLPAFLHRARGRCGRQRWERIGGQR
jgi:hypothetical protein